MLAGPNATIDTMIAAVADSIHALEAASELDVDRSAADRKFFAARKKLLMPVLAQLVAAKRALEDHDIGEGSRLQTRVEIGDKVLDRGVSDGNTRTKLGLKGKAGLDATHVFGKNVATLTKEKIALEPAKVLEAAERMVDLPDFPDKSRIAKDLKKRAEQQQRCLDEREAGSTERSKLVSTIVKLVADASNTLAALKGALDEQLPRQRDYVSAFFMDVAPERASKAAGPAPSTAKPAPKPGTDTPA